MRAVLDSLLREHPYGFCLEQWRRSSYGPVSTFSLLESASCVRAPCKLSANSPLFFFSPCVKLRLKLIKLWVVIIYMCYVITCLD